MKIPQRMIRIGLALALIVLGATASARGQATAKRAVPVYEEPRHRPVFQNALVRVLDVRVPPGETTAFHVHSNRHFGVVIADASGRYQDVREDTLDSPSMAMPAGTVFDNAIDTLPYTHRGVNVDTVGLRYVVGQLLASSGIASSALPASSGLHLDREVLGARIYRVTLAPGQSTPKHRHAAPGLTVQVNAGTLRVAGSKPEGTSAETGAGAWWWRGSGAEHSLRNDGATPVEVVEIDWP
jgi:quercetin dioxygenase-like cupin family protein